MNRTVQDLREDVERTNEIMAALSTIMDTTSDRVTRLRETVEGLGRTAEVLDGTIPLLVSCVIELHFRAVRHADGMGEQRSLPESYEQARGQ